MAPFEVFLKIAVALWIWDIIRRPKLGVQNSKPPDETSRQKVTA